MTSLHDCTKSNAIDDCPYESKVDTKVVSVCNEGSTIVVPLPSVSNQSFSPIPIVSVDVNTNCLCNSIVKIDFKSIINYQCFITVTGTPTLRLFVPLRITFQLTRTRNDGAKTLLKSWDYSYS
ncbi:DUF4489 domain-containing protein, partial [Clostridium sp.]|uniref:DUF4489 domain-containing protein n=1 Tax=Clostridium sp. TaxID=1506 RepID=UPI003463B6FC